MKLKVAHLFSGIEGFRHGLERSTQSCTNNQGGTSQYGGCAFHTVYSNDIDKYACAISRYNYPDGTTDERDIRAIDPDGLPDFDLLTFGFPCQDLSIAGRKDGLSGQRSSLFFEAMRIVRAKRPRLIIVENVPGLFSKKRARTIFEKRRDFLIVLQTITDCGYDCQWQVVNTRWFLPQNRERIYIIGHLRGTRRPEVLPIGETDFAYSENNGGIKAVVNCLDSNYHKGWLDHGQRTMICLYDDKAHVSIGTQIRRLTPIECERLQGFPDNWTRYGIDKNGKKIEISDTQRYKCLGNAVSTVIPEMIGRKLLAFYEANR